MEFNDSLTFCPDWFLGVCCSHSAYFTRYPFREAYDPFIVYLFLFVIGPGGIGIIAQIDCTQAAFFNSGAVVKGPTEGRSQQYYRPMVMVIACKWTW
jgi:hypothetical protein